MNFSENDSKILTRGNRLAMISGKGAGETVMTICDDKICVELSDIGEGYWGDYNENDFEDEPLLRFYVYQNQDILLHDEGQMEDDEFAKLAHDWEDDWSRITWEYIDDSSYCTCISANSSEKELQEYIKVLFDNFRDEYDKICPNYDKVGQNLSWLGSEDKEQERE